MSRFRHRIDRRAPGTSRAAVCTKANVNAGKRCRVPSQTNRQRRWSMSGWNVVGVAGADAAVEAIGRDHDVGVELARGGDVIRDVGVVDQFDAQRLAPRLQDVEQALAANAAEPVTAARDRASLEMDVDVVPVIEGIGDVARRLWVGGREVVQRLVGEHDAPPERVARPVAFDHAHDVAGVRLPEQQREIEAGGAAADAKHAHGRVTFLQPQANPRRRYLQIEYLRPKLNPVKPAGRAVNRTCGLCRPAHWPRRSSFLASKSSAPAPNGGNHATRSALPTMAAARVRPARVA